MARVAIRICMIIFLFFMFLSSIFMFIVYVSGSDYGHLNAFYFTLILITLFDGFTNAFAFCLNGAQSSMLSAAIPLSGALVTILHYVYKFFYDSYHWDDFDYYVLRIQLLCNILIILFALCIWSFDQGIDLRLMAVHRKKTDNSHNLFGTATTECAEADFKWSPAPNNYKYSEDKRNCVHNISVSGSLLDLFQPHQHVSVTNDGGNYGDWSPILLLAISLGTVYAFYPSIAPYSIIDYQYASIIELWILCISAIPPLLFAILDLISDVPTPTKWYGPSGLNKRTADTDPSGAYLNWNPNKYKKGGSGTYYGNWWWHCVWFCAIPYILCIQIFMSMLHYPHSFLSSFFNNHPLRISFISILFNTLREAMQACGFAGAGKQNYSDAQKASPGATPNKVNGAIASCNKPITLFVMFCVFTGDGYLQHYRRCCRDCWPTTGYNKYQSFFYWLHFGFKGGIKSITSSFTDLYYHNLRPQFISYA